MPIGEVVLLYQSVIQEALNLEGVLIEDGNMTKPRRLNRTTVSGEMDHENKRFLPEPSRLVHVDHLSNRSTVVEGVVPSSTKAVIIQGL